jgi:hypothetical protein
MMRLVSRRVIELVNWSGRVSQSGCDRVSQSEW